MLGGVDPETDDSLQRHRSISGCALSAQGDIAHNVDKALQEGRQGLANICPAVVAVENEQLRVSSPSPGLSFVCGMTHRSDRLRSCMRRDVSYGLAQSVLNRAYFASLNPKERKSVCNVSI